LPRPQLPKPLPGRCCVLDRLFWLGHTARYVSVAHMSPKRTGTARAPSASACAAAARSEPVIAPLRRALAAGLLEHVASRVSMCHIMQPQHSINNSPMPAVDTRGPAAPLSRGGRPWWGRSGTRGTVVQSSRRLRGATTRRPHALCYCIPCELSCLADMWRGSERVRSRCA
jgi:hypothetical protein